MDDILNVYFLSTLSETMLLFKREVLFVLGGIKVNELPGHGKMYPQATNGWSLSGSWLENSNLHQPQIRCLMTGEHQMWYVYSRRARLRQVIRDLWVSSLRKGDYWKKHSKGMFRLKLERQWFIKDCHVRGDHVWLIWLNFSVVTKRSITLTSSVYFKSYH